MPWANTRRPAAAHCELASVDGLTFLACACDASHAGQKSSDSNQCGCLAAEKSQYHAGQLRVTPPSPGLLPVAFAPLADAEKSLPAEVSLGILTAAPPQLLQTWQFASRTA